MPFGLLGSTQRTSLYPGTEISLPKALVKGKFIFGVPAFGSMELILLTFQDDGYLINVFVIFDR